MNENVKRLFHVRFLMHPCYAEIIATRPEIRLDKLENDTPDKDAEPVLSAAHAYQVSSARDEVPRAALPERYNCCPTSKNFMPA